MQHALLLSSEFIALIHPLNHRTEPRYRIDPTPAVIALADSLYRAKTAAADVMRPSQTGHPEWTINTRQRDLSYNQVTEEDLTRFLILEPCKMQTRIVEMLTFHRRWDLAANLMHAYLVEEAWAASQISSINATAPDHPSTLRRADFPRTMYPSTHLEVRTLDVCSHLMPQLALEEEVVACAASTPQSRHLLRHICHLTYSHHGTECRQAVPCPIVSLGLHRHRGHRRRANIPEEPYFMMHHHQQHLKSPCTLAVLVKSPIHPIKRGHHLSQTPICLRWDPEGHHDKVLLRLHPQDRRDLNFPLNNFEVQIAAWLTSRTQCSRLIRPLTRAPLSEVALQWAD